MDSSLEPDAAGLRESPVPATTPGWRRVAARSAGICGAALAAQLPAVLLVGWPLAPAAVAALFGNQLVDYGCVGLVVSLTLLGVERAAHRPRRWRHALLVAGLIAAVATQLKPGTAREFNAPEMDAHLQHAGLNTDPDALRLYQLWFSAILAGVSAIYLMQRQESIEAEQRRGQLEAQWQQARRRVRILRDAAGAARLDPQVLFDCLALARDEYLQDAASADALLDRLIDFLRGTLSGTRAGPHTLGLELGLAVRFAAVVAGAGPVQIVDAVPPALRGLDLCPGLLLPLVQQWLAAGRHTPAASRPLRFEASLQGKEHRLLSLQLSGPVIAFDALLSESRTRLVDLYGSQARVSAEVSGSRAPQLDVRFELPLEASHAA